MQSKILKSSKNLKGLSFDSFRTLFQETLDCVGLSVHELRIHSQHKYTDIKPITLDFFILRQRFKRAHYVFV